MATIGRVGQQTNSRPGTPSVRLKSPGLEESESDQERQGYRRRMQRRENTKNETRNQGQNRRHHRLLKKILVSASPWVWFLNLGGFGDRHPTQLGLRLGVSRHGKQPVGGVIAIIVRKLCWIKQAVLPVSTSSLIFGTFFLVVDDGRMVDRDSRILRMAWRSVTISDARPEKDLQLVGRFLISPSALLGSTV